jgi:hypothetical protein
MYYERITSVFKINFCFLHFLFLGVSDDGPLENVLNVDNRMRNFNNCFIELLISEWQYNKIDEYPLVPIGMNGLPASAEPATGF